MVNKVERVANALEEAPRREIDLEAANLLRELGRVLEVAREMVMARTNEQSRAAYLEMVNLIKSKKPD